ncbi:hypothetical protein KEM54_005690 [Ascosphaera aggregata]|nr:hypothetical protein KEM54_005690 [Ascosphaera aggregata]
MEEYTYDVETSAGDHLVRCATLDGRQWMAPSVPQPSSYHMFTGLESVQCNAEDTGKHIMALRVMKISRLSPYAALLTLGEGRCDDSLDKAGKNEGELTVIFDNNVNTHNSPPECRDLISKTLHDTDAFIRDELSKGRYDPALTQVCAATMVELLEAHPANSDIDTVTPPVGMLHARPADRGRGSSELGIFPDASEHLGFPVTRRLMRLDVTADVDKRLRYRNMTDFGKFDGFSSVHIAAIAATNWILLMNGLTSLQLRVDGDAIALAFISGTAGLIFICTGYIALDTAFDWTGQFVTTKADGYRNYALYVLYQLFPLVCLVLYFLTQGFTCLVALGEFVPFFFLMIATVLFTLGQVFQYILSRHICAVSGGKINGSIFENFFTLLALASIWILWDNITEDGTENGQQLTP